MNKNNITRVGFARGEFTKSEKPREFEWENVGTIIGSINEETGEYEEREYNNKGIEVTLKESVDKRIEEWAKDRGLDKLNYSNILQRASELEELSEEMRAMYNRDLNEALDADCDSYIYLKVDMMKQNIHTARMYNLEIMLDLREKTFREKTSLNIYEVLDETLKEIESRTGEWSEKDGKWKKYETEEAKALWYKADYSKWNRLEVRSALEDFRERMEEDPNYVRDEDAWKA